MRQGLTILILLLGIVLTMFAVSLRLELTRHRWWRRWRGGHWELIDFDRLHSSFRGRIWLRFERCSTEGLGFEPHSRVCCEDYTEVGR